MAFAGQGQFPECCGLLQQGHELPLNRNRTAARHFCQCMIYTTTTWCYKSLKPQMAKSTS
jgi:hypothetical protein